MLYEMDCTGSGVYRYAQKDLSFAGWKEVICPGCGRRVSLPVYSESNPVLVLEGGKKYPDFLQFCGAGSLSNGGRLIVLSEKALTVFREEGISGMGECKPVAFDSSEASRYCVDDAPAYYALNITGSVDLDYSAMSNLKRKNFCPTCRQFDWSRKQFGRFILDANTWSGHDICRLASMPGVVFASEKLKRVVRKHKLTNFCFSET